MSRIKIAIVKSREDVLAATIALDLGSSPEFDLVSNELIRPHEARARLFAIVRSVDVLIAIGDFQAELLEEVVRYKPHAVAASILIANDTVNLRLSKVGSVQLMETLYALARDRSSDRLRLLEYQLVGGSSKKAGRLVELTRAGGHLVHEADAWVRSTICSYAQSLPRGEGDYLTYARGTQIIEDLVREATPRRQPGEDAVAAKDQELVEAVMAAASASTEPLARLFNRLRLTATEFKLLLLALGPDLGVNIQIAFGHLNDDLGRKYPTFGLACAMLGNPIDVRAELEQAGNLVRWRLLASGDVLPAPDDYVRLAQPLPAWLLGNDDAILDDTSLRPFIRRLPYPGAAYVPEAEGAHYSSRLGEAFATGKAWVVAPPEHVDRWRARCEVVAESGAQHLLRCDAVKLAALEPADQREAVIRLARTAQLLGTTPVVDFGTEPADDNRFILLASLTDSLACVSQPAVLIASDRRYAAALPAADMAVHAANDAETEAAEFYRAAATANGLRPLPGECERLGTEFPVTLDVIQQAVELAARDLRGTPDDGIHEAMARACRVIASSSLSRMATVSAPVFSLPDVILPREQHAQLQEIVNQMAHATTVLNGWGFGAQLPYGRGVSVLFSGPSGTGKTMAAQAVAKALGTDLFTVDLSQVVSKYIGESEKNLDAVFTDAERTNAVLNFNEADSLLTKRSETKDAHDRYANLEVAYLLQRMESFTGLAILTTNLKQNIDSAFLRRLRFVVEFPKPDAGAREAIWRQCLPASAPVAADVQLHLLARELELSGGNIRQVTLRAAFAAAGDGSGQIEMRHLLVATRAELAKLGQGAALRRLDELEAYLNRAMAA